MQSSIDKKGGIRAAYSWLIRPPVSGPAATLLLRCMAGGVFFSEGLLKFVYPNQGVGRFTKLGFPFPDATATFVGSLEIVGGCLLILGLLSRAIAIPFIVEMIVAILTTKISLYLGTSPLPLPPALPKIGFWAVMHETRSDYAQLLTVAFLLIAGPGKWSLDALVQRRSSLLLRSGVQRRSGVLSDVTLAESGRESATSTLSPVQANAGTSWNERGARSLAGTNTEGSVSHD